MNKSRLLQLPVLIVMTLVLIMHGVIGWWLMHLSLPEKTKPVELLSMEWVDDPKPEPVVQPQTAQPQPEMFESVAEPDPVMVTKAVAPPPPEKTTQPKVVKKLTKPVEKKLPVAEPVKPIDAPLTGQTSIAESQPASEPRAAEVQKTLVKAEADYLNNPKPSYPRLSKRMGEQGEVRLKVQVGADGSVLHVELFKTSGYERLDEAAVNAVKTWKFRPAMRGDEAMSSWVEIPVKFILEES